MERESDELTAYGRPASFDANSLTYSLTEAASRFPCSERWLAKQIRVGRFQARKICGHWRMTQADIEYAIERCRNDGRTPANNADCGLTSTSRRRLERAKASP